LRQDVRNRQDQDFRWLLGILGGFASLHGVIGRGFHWL
jgi:hypothetical protein